MTESDPDRQVLRRQGLSVTRMRLAIMEALRKRGSVATPAELLRHLKGEGPVHKSTVYRNMAALERAGLVRKVPAGGRSLHYELAAGRSMTVHPHFTCHSCRKVVCLEPLDLSSIWGLLTQDSGLRPERAEITLVGLCPACATKGTTSG